MEEGVAGIDGQLLDLLLVLGVGVVGIPVWPEPQLGVGVEAVAKHRNRVEGRHKIPDVSHLLNHKKFTPEFQKRAKFSKTSQPYYVDYDIR